MPESRRAEWPSTQVSLIQRLGTERDDATWGFFLDIYLPPVYSFCRRRGLQDADACDVTQNVMSAVSRSIADFEYDSLRGQFRAWLGTITWREINRYSQRAERAVRGTGNGIGNQQIDRIPKEPEAVWIDLLGAHLLDLALKRTERDFDPLAWNTFKRVWQHDESPSEVARSLDKSVGWVYKTKFLVVQRLKQELKYLTSDEILFT